MKACKYSVLGQLVALTKSSFIATQVARPKDHRGKSGMDLTESMEPSFERLKPIVDYIRSLENGKLHAFELCMDLKVKDVHVHQKRNLTVTPASLVLDRLVLYILQARVPTAIDSTCKVPTNAELDLVTARQRLSESMETRGCKDLDHRPQCSKSSDCKCR